MKLPEIAVEMRCSVKTVYRRIEQKALKAFKEGGRWLVWRSDLLAYLNHAGTFQGAK
jgi:excisionase family DNA binding protein